MVNDISTCCSILQLLHITACSAWLMSFILSCYSLIQITACYGWFISFILQRVHIIHLTFRLFWRLFCRASCFFLSISCTVQPEALVATSGTVTLVGGENNLLFFFLTLLPLSRSLRPLVSFI